ncbi:MAG: hypothetical protein M3Q22_01755 [Actinomycetota bacterium]|nr:hypothetical protein [Actinomycetota bacterium]
MPKSKKRAKSRRPAQRRTSPETELLDALVAGVDSPTPGPLLGTVGLVLAVAAGADDPAATLDNLVRSFSAVHRVETSAALLAIAALTVDTDLRRRVRREIAESGHVLPRWLAELDRTEPVDRAVEISTVFRDADELLVGVTVPGGHPLAAVVRIENELGAVATDGYVMQSPLDSVVPLLVEDDDPDVHVRDISSADARARITAAVQELDLGPSPFVSETWAGSRPLVEWMLSPLPRAVRTTCCGTCRRRSSTRSPTASSPGVHRGRATICGRCSMRSWRRAAPTTSAIRSSGAPAMSAGCSTCDCCASTPRRRTSTAHRTCSAT